jgi:tetratricopeptide (TPR) repeat protein
MYRNPFFFQAHQALRDGRYLEAIDLYRKAARTPEQARRWISAVWYQLGQQSRMAGRHLEAADHFRAALREMPAHQGAAINLVHSFADGGKSHQALSALRRLPRGLRDVRRLLHLEARGWLGPAERAALRRLGADRPTLTGPGMLGNL